MHPQRGRFKLEKLSKYPHLRPEDVAIWERFIAAHPEAYDSVDYDVRVGEGAPTPPEAPPEIADDFHTLTQKRIDVVAHRPGEIWIIEVRPRADQTALGNLMGYRTLYQRQFSPAETVKLMVITDRIGDDDRMIFMTAGVPVVVV